MSEVTFKSVKEYVAHLKETGSETAEVSVLEAILARPAGSGERRGMLAGLSVSEMDDEQLKREIINANSVLYKAKQRGASDDTIAKNQARVDAAYAEKAKREPEVTAEEDVAATEEAVYSEDVAAEL